MTPRGGIAPGQRIAPRRWTIASPPARPARTGTQWRRGHRPSLSNCRTSGRRLVWSARRC